MRPIDGYDQAPAYTGESIALPAGLYKCTIRQVNVILDNKQREQMVICFDILEGTQKDGYVGPTAVEKSNPGYRWDWNEKGLVGKCFGGVFQREEFVTKDGQKKMATKCVQIRSMDGLKEAKVPEDKLLPDKPAGYPDPANASMPVGDGFMSIPEGAEDEGIPFM